MALHTNPTVEGMMPEVTTILQAQLSMTNPSDLIFLT